MTWKPAPSLISILLDANRVAPNRSYASDGIIGDAAHSASVSDHNPDSRGIVHACDITNDPAGGFNAWERAQEVGQRMLAGSETRVKYLVSNDGSKDVILNPSVSRSWRQNGAVKQEHANHLHVSIQYTAAAENDQTPFFSAGAQGEVVTQAEIDAIIAGVDAKLNRVIGAFQQNMKQEFIPTIVSAVAKAIATGAASGVDEKALADELARDIAARLAQ